MRGIFWVITFLLAIGFTPNMAQSADQKADANSAGDEDLTPFIQGEAMIANSEEKALKQIEKLIKKYKGSAKEPDLMYRQAELYMRRAKAGRFFDLYRNDKKVATMVPPKVSQNSAKTSLIKAIGVYGQLLSRFPKYVDTDAVLFNKAFAHAQIGEIKESERLYRVILKDHKDSSLTPETLISLGELLYEGQNFSEALALFERLREFKNNKMYPFALYKSAWSLYNLQRTSEALLRLEDIIALQPRITVDAQKGKYYLRTEAHRDMALFFGDVHTADFAVPYFKKHSEDEELGGLIIQLAKLYEGHSRQKELVQFLTEFTNKFPLNQKAVEAFKFIAEAEDTVKKREAAMVAIERMHKLCELESPWAKMNKESFAEVCGKMLPEYTLDVAKRWWELWTKNKASTQLAGSSLAKATTQIFNLHLSSAAGKNDLKNRYAFAELLFQNSDFNSAATQYEEVGRNIEDKKIRHDAIYAAIVCLDKVVEKDKKAKPRLLGLVEYYVDKHPTGEFFASLQLKRAQLMIDADNRLKAEEIAKTLLAQKDPAIRKKAEDIYLDLLILRKEYKMVKEQSSLALKNEADKDRKDRLTSTYKDSQLLLINEDAKGGKEVQAADQFLAFYNEHKGSEKALDALWNAIALYFSNGREFEGAESAWTYANQSSDKVKIKKALEQATKAYLSVGQLKKAALAQESYLKTETDPKKKRDGLWLMAELFELDLARKEAEKLYIDLYKSSGKEEKKQMTEKLLAFFADDSKNPFLKQIEQEIDSQKMEPFFTDKKLAEMREQMKKAAFSQAFESARKIMSGDGTTEQKTEARLAQAFILELEHNSQSVKASVDRLATVLGLKTEKLDKASSSYSQALKMANTSKLQVQALDGLRRVYNNYVSSLSNLTLTSEVSADDMNILRTEIKKLTEPIAEKEMEVAERLQKLSVDTDVAGSGSDFASLAYSESYVYPVSMPELSELRSFVPAWPDTRRWLALGDIASNTCTEQTINEKLSVATLGENINKCIKAQKWQKVEMAALWMLKKDPKNPWGAFYIAQVAINQKNLPRAEWFMNLAEQKEPKSALLSYQRARLHTQLGHESQARESFSKSNSIEMLVMEQRLFRGLLSYQQGKCAESVEDLNMALKASTGRMENLVIAMSECFSKNGKLQDAVSLVESSLRSKKSLVLWLQMGRLSEQFLNDTKKALNSYNEALKLAETTPQKDWLQGKIKYLGQSGNKVTKNGSSENQKAGNL